MSKRPIRPAVDSTNLGGPAPRASGTAYPSLREHLASRRRFLGLAGATGASLAAGGLFTACYRGLGQAPDPDAQVPAPDARTSSPDAHVEMPGEAPWPTYFTLRIPATDSLSAYLVDGGYCTFYLELVTYDETTYLTLLDHLDTATERCRSTLADFTYDTLATASGVASAEEDLRDELDALATELTGSPEPTIEAATLTITFLEPYAPMDGGMPEPSYP